MPEPPPPEAFSHAPSSLAPLTIYENRRVHNCERTLGEVLPGRRKGLCAARSHPLQEWMRCVMSAPLRPDTVSVLYSAAPVGTHVEP